MGKASDNAPTASLRLTIDIQKDSRQGKEANWLPAADGLFFLQFRCYWQKQAILDGS
jgi:hypothetical protein